MIVKYYNNSELSTFTYIKNFFTKEYYQKILIWLETSSFIKGYKNSGDVIDREQIWYENNNNYFCKVWKERKERWSPHKYNNFLYDIQSKISDRTNINIDSCLINKYKNGNDIISPHKDNAVSFGLYPNIIIYSLGSKRELRINSDIDNKFKIFDLEPNSLFIMSGASQKYFTHEIIKNDSKEVRYSLTFRKYINK